MPITLEQIQENCRKARESMGRARAEHYAFGAFNLDDEPTLRAVAGAAKAVNAPVLVEVSQGEVDTIGLANVRDMVDNFKAEYGIEMYVNLDHSPSVEAAKQGIDAGFEFIHIDVSQANHDATDDEIIAATKEVVEYAKKTGALVEAEPHYFAGGSNLFKEAFDYEEIKKTFSTPEGAKHFVEATGIDTFISLHGGSGTPGHYFVDAVKIGVTKVNINTDMRVGYRKALEQALADNPDEYSVAKLVQKIVVPAVEAVVASKLQDFNSADKARP
jgi:fructose-bisphosphate aldolase class II